MDNACHGDWPFLFWAPSGGLFLTNMRRVALALLVLSGVLGFFSRLGGWNEVALSEPSLDLRNIAAGQNIGARSWPTEWSCATAYPCDCCQRSARALFSSVLPIY